MRIVWVGLAVPEQLAQELASQDKYLTTQTQRFQTSVISALEVDGHTTVKIISSPPVTDWSRVKVTGVLRWSHRGDSDSDWVVPVLNYVLLKQVSVALGCFLGAFFTTLNNSQRDTVILVGDSYFPHLVAAWLAGVFTRVPVFAIVTDMPGLLVVADPWYKRLLRPLDVGSVRWMLRQMRGLIVLSHHMATDFFPGKQHIVMEGIATPVPTAPASEGDQLHAPFIIMYAGGLLREYGVELLLSAFRDFSDLDCELWITGKGDLEEAVERAAQNDPRIKWLGFVSTDELNRRLDQASVLVSLRLDHRGHARYSFPSKLIDYMTRNAFVVSNRFPSLPSDYEPHLVMLDEETPMRLANVFRRIKAGGLGSRREFSRRTAEFVRNRTAPSAQGKKMRTFLGQFAAVETGEH